MLKVWINFLPIYQTELTHCDTVTRQNSPTVTLSPDRTHPLWHRHQTGLPHCDIVTRQDSPTLWHRHQTRLPHCDIITRQDSPTMTLSPDGRLPHSDTVTRQDSPHCDIVTRQDSPTLTSSPDRTHPLFFLGSWHLCLVFLCQFFHLLQVLFLTPLLCRPPALFQLPLYVRAGSRHRLTLVFLEIPPQLKHNMGNYGNKENKT